MYKRYMAVLGFIHYPFHEGDVPIGIFSAQISFSRFGYYMFSSDTIRTKRYPLVSNFLPRTTERSLVENTSFSERIKSKFILLYATKLSSFG